MENTFNRTALGSYEEIWINSGKYNYYENFDDSDQLTLLEKLGQIKKKDLLFILSVNSFGMFVILYFLLYLLY